MGNRRQLIKQDGQAGRRPGDLTLQVVADQGRWNPGCIVASIMAYVPNPMSYRITLANYALHGPTSDSAREDVANLAHTVSKNTLIVTG
jgi:hypothetical protein